MKISIIGAGSRFFTRRIMGQMSQMSELSGTEISLIYNRQSQKSENVTKWVKRIVHENGDNLSITGTTDRNEGLQGADYVICVIDVGGSYARRLDFEIPLKYGLLQTIGDTIGVAGMFKGFRLVPHLLELCRDIEDLCPDAWLLNLSNPLAINCRAIAIKTNIKTLGICSSPEVTVSFLAKILQVDEEELDYMIAGINHFSWLLSLTHKGRNMYPDLIRKSRFSEVFKQQPVRFRLLQIFGYFVTEGDAWVAEYLPYFLHKGRVKEYNLRPSRPSINKAKDERYIQILQRDLSSSNPLIVKPSYEGEKTPKIILSLENGGSQKEIVNIPNLGYINNLPKGTIVEVPALVGGYGVKGVNVGNLPFGISGFENIIAYEQELAARAAVNGDKKAALHAILNHPLTSCMLSIKEAEKMLEEMFMKEAKWLPQFSK